MQLVTKETVDADIYDMQERKSKMNAAILESNAEKKERREMLQSAMNRFLASSPPPGKKLSTANANNKENVQEVQEDMFHL